MSSIWVICVDWTSVWPFNCQQGLLVSPPWSNNNALEEGSVCACRTGGGVGVGVGFGCRKLFQRSRGLNSIVMKSIDILKGSIPFVSRGDIGVLTKNVRKVIILKGPHISGKTSVVAHIMSNERYPWYMRALFPAHGFIFKWDGHFTDTRSWMQSQLPAENREEDPLYVIDELRVELSNKQYFRNILFKVFHNRLPDVMRPQPLVVVFYQAEELIGRLGADFVDYVNELTKTACDQPQSLAKDYMDQLDRGDIVESPGASRPQLKAMRADFADLTEDVCGQRTSDAGDVDGLAGAV